MRVHIEVAKAKEHNILQMYVTLAEVKFNEKTEYVAKVAGVPYSTFCRYLKGIGSLGLEGWRRITTRYGSEMLDTWFDSIQGGDTQ